MLLVVNTTLILSLVRSHFTEEGIDAYLVPHAGSHNGLRAACEGRILGVSGFSGVGSVVVTTDAALLWTDNRYFEEAETTLDENWTLMRQGEPGVPTEEEYLAMNFPSGSSVGVDAKTLSRNDWLAKFGTLASAEITLKAVSRNLVDLEWEERPQCSANPAIDLPLQFSGKSIREKLTEVRQAMSSEVADMALVSELDEVAWLVNLRGSDFPTVFYSFAIVTLGEAFLLVKPNTVDETVAELLLENGVLVYEEYDQAAQFLSSVIGESVHRVWLSKFVNAEMFLAVPTGKAFVRVGPVVLLEAVKNPVEIDGLRSAFLKSSLAMVSFFSWLETEIQNAEVSEITASDKVTEFEQKGEHYVMPSFAPISAFGTNSAIAAYRPTPLTNQVITTQEIYLLDAGSHYLDGTTDITRTIHLGQPTDQQMDSFTRVFKGQMGLSRAIFPNKVRGDRLDSFARQFLWEGHIDNENPMTGHSLGHYLYLHPGFPMITANVDPDDTGLLENMLISNEPGYFKHGEFGVRMENMMRMAANGDGFLAIEILTFVPFQLKMIKEELMTGDEIVWLDAYHVQCREKLLQLIENVDYVDPSVIPWIEQATQPFANFNAQRRK